MMGYAHNRCRAVIVIKDGPRIATRWREHKLPSELGPDEFPRMMRLIKAAERYAKRKGLQFYSISGEYTSHG